LDLVLRICFGFRHSDFELALDKGGGDAMKQIFFALAVLSSAAVAIVPQEVRSQVPGKGTPFDVGSGDKGATLKQPWLDSSPSAPPSAAPSGQAPNYLQNLLDSSGASKSAPSSGSLTSSLQPYDTMGINNDILITPEVGPWVILVTSYSGRDGPMRARQMVNVLRAHYKLPAFVFNFGAEEKRKELARVTKLIEEQKAKLREELKQQNLPLDQVDHPIRVRHEKIDEHCGVLVGGYSTMEAAAKARDNMRKLPFDAEVFKLEKTGDLLDTKFYTSDPDGKSKSKTGTELVYVNPFMRAMPVHNPTTKVERPADAGKLDVAALRHMNSDEDFSLFKCKKTYTLAIKQFSLPTQTGVRNDPAPFGFGKKQADHADHAAENAHELAKALRKGKLEAYVLHMKYYSLVTVGGFDSLEDPNLRSMQNLLDTRLIPSLDSLQMFPKAMPMQIPR
jgi:hypothetical protein